MHLLALIPILILAGVWLSPSPAWADKRGVRVDGKTPEDYIAAQTGKSYAVVIGINDYEKVPRLTYAKADAESIAKTLKQRGFAVTELYDKQASRRNILSELGDKLVDRVKEEDRVLIFYAGHGETKQRTGGKEIGYLLPVGGEQDALAETAIPMSMIRDLADALPAKQVLFLVDVCYGGIAGQQFRSLPKYTVDYLKAITRERGRQLITAGGPKQQAMEGPEWGHSVFTYYLLEGLDRGRADLNDDGIIPATELYAYLDERVFFFTNRGSQVGTAARERTLAAEKAAVAEERKKLDVAKAYGAASLKGHEQRPVMWTMAAEKGEFVDLPKQAGREIEGKDGAKMLLIPAGEFMMGSTEGTANEKPVHRVSLDAFYLDKYEVTNRLFQKFVQATGYQTTAEKEGKAWAYVQDDKWTEVSGANWRKPEGGETVFVSNRDEHPVVSVSWYDADAYCRWADKRLPTEAEFEYANRAGTTTTYWWGNGNPGSRRVANIADMTNKQRFPGRPWPIMEGYDDGYGRTAPVGSFEPNPFGLHDMTGNVVEWTADWYGKNFYERSPNHNPTGPSDGQSRVLRGGSWYGDPLFVRTASRDGLTPSVRLDGIGFRCAKTP